MLTLITWFNIFEFNIPFYFITESFEYSCLLNKASEEVNPIRRLELVSAYALSTCSSTERFTKPFNSLLGETYELVRSLKLITK